MPRLVLFAACEKAIVDKSNVISLMSLLENINVQIPPGIIPPANALAPMPWTIFSLWQRTDNDHGEAFEQRSALVTAAGATLLETPVALIDFKASPLHRVVSQIVGMPIANAGSHNLKAFIREKGTSNWIEAGTYPLSIQWVSTVAPTVH